ncbi:RNA polymerase sigma factor [Carboxylicivirga sp. M1479]|uniref:RNA polymerase sigma factor n=1 Tax=Carboxylicivirga sp. M1479 TaxID=2594476 RepID=UPI001178BE70|nr:sigma-70 family RNA polymerase sigma factor [Carboxylicivirga sp. M1479]TRX61162.1 sigma-70 family RNA polymerase sigma factor [Carboxylicivirga sp. M1479]
MAQKITDIHKPIIVKAAKGNAKAQRNLYELYAKAMFNICYRMMNSIEDAEDMLQEVFCEAFKRLDSFRFDSTFGAWIKRICINKCINELKRRKLNLELNEEITPDAMQDDVEETNDIELKVEHIKHAMGMLPHGYRIVFSLYMLEGYDHQEIADIMQITVSTSKSQLARAKKKLLEILKAGSMELTLN